MQGESELVNAPFSVLAVDPGLSGAVCKIGLGRFEILRDFKTLSDIAKAIQRLASGATHAVIEAVHAMPGQGVVSMFSFGRSTGVALGALALCLPESVELQPVAPQKWQNDLRTRFQIAKSTAFDSRGLASTLFPGYALTYFKRKLDHNSADAVLMALWKLYSLLPGSP